LKENKMASDEQRKVFEYLVEQAKLVGVIPVKEACGMFIRLGLKTITSPERRRPIPRQWVEFAWKKQKGRCAICKKPLALDEAAGDHVDPHGLNGEHKKSNIVAVHGTRSEVNCNSIKGGRSVFDESKRRGELMNEMFPNLEEEVING
jgi:hypothetical protein